MLKRLLAAISTTTLIACATSSQPSDPSGNTMGSLSEMLNQSVQSLNTAVSTLSKKADTNSSTSGNRVRLRNTELNGLFNKTSSTEWPRVALTINKLPKWFYGAPPQNQPGVYTPKDCINVTLVAWKDKKTSKVYEGIEFCGDDIVPQVPYSDVGLMWKSFGIVTTAPHTGNNRTTGPVPPQRLFPNKTGLDLFFQINGAYYVGSIMETLGYNWKDPQDYRFWIVNLPTRAETVR